MAKMMGEEREAQAFGCQRGDNVACGVPRNPRDGWSQWGLGFVEISLVHWCCARQGSWQNMGCFRGYKDPAADMKESG